MTQVRELTPGDVVEGFGTASGTVIVTAPHPLYPGLKMVVWRLSDGTISIDALSPFQYVGETRRTNEAMKRDALALAINPGGNRE